MRELAGRRPGPELGLREGSCLWVGGFIPNQWMTCSAVKLSCACFLEGLPCGTQTKPGAMLGEAVKEETAKHGRVWGDPEAGTPAGLTRLSQSHAAG